MSILFEVIDCNPQGTAGASLRSAKHLSYQVYPQLQPDNDGDLIQEPKRLLKDPKLSNQKIIDIASRSGFSSSTSFNRIFKQYEKRSPSEYRKLKSSSIG